MSEPTGGRGTGNLPRERSITELAEILLRFNAFPFTDDCVTSGSGCLKTGRKYLAKRGLKVSHGAINVLQLFQPEQADPEGLKIRPFVALQRYASRGLQSLSQELPA